jgi:hypothetical protein
LDAAGRLRCSAEDEVSSDMLNIVVYQAVIDRERATKGRLETFVRIDSVKLSVSSRVTLGSASVQGGLNYTAYSSHHDGCTGLSRRPKATRGKLDSVNSS